MSTIKVFSPYDQHFISEVPRFDEKQANTALALAHDTYNDRTQWLKPYERKAILEKTVEIMQTRKEELALAAAEEGGKPLIDSRIEAERAIQGVIVAIEHISQMTGHEIAMNQTPSSANRYANTFRLPVGVVLAISAFNHPLNLIVHQVIPAVAVGAPVIVKPASSTPLSAFNLVNILYEAGLDKKWAQVLPCNNKVAEQLVSDPRISFLSFIGSAKVGWYLRSKLPPGATCALEHGGAAPVIIEADADIEDALPLLTKGGFYHAGQVCVSVQRIFAHQSICQTIAEKMAAMAKKLTVGDPSNAKTEVGPLISTKEVDRVESWVKEAITKGAKCLCGGNRISDTCFEPTVLLNPPMDTSVSQHEIFGPVVCIYSYDDIDEAIELANSLDYCFQASIFTKNLDTAIKGVKQLEATAVMVNDHTAFRVDWMPFGGRKQSGLGFGGIPYSMHDMTYEKMMVIRSSFV